MIGHGIFTLSVLIPNFAMEPSSILAAAEIPFLPSLTGKYRNNRIQRFTLDGKQTDFVEGTSMPYHFACSKMAICWILQLGVTVLDRNDRVVKHQAAQTLRLGFGSPLLLGNKPRHVE